MSLEEKLKARIAAEGPIGVDEYMAAANAHYYATRDPLGAEGDFITAPEIHQMDLTRKSGSLHDSQRICCKRSPARPQLGISGVGRLARAHPDIG